MGAVAATASYGVIDRAQAIRLPAGATEILSPFTFHLSRGGTRFSPQRLALRTTHNPGPQSRLDLGSRNE